MHTDPAKSTKVLPFHAHTRECGVWALRVRLCRELGEAIAAPLDPLRDAYLSV